MRPPLPLKLLDFLKHDKVLKSTFHFPEKVDYYNGKGISDDVSPISKEFEKINSKSFQCKNKLTKELRMLSTINDSHRIRKGESSNESVGALTPFYS